MLREAVILAGGKGTRLQSRLGGRPKPLIDVVGTPLLERQIVALQQAGIAKVLVLVNHQAAQVRQFCQARADWGIEVECVDDGEARGTAGAVLRVLDRLEEEFLVVYGDTLFEIDLPRFAAFHAARGGEATLLLHPNDHPQDSDLVEVDEHGVIREFHSSPHAVGSWHRNLVNAAMYIVRRDLLRRWSPPPGQPILDFAKDFFPSVLGDGARLLGYRTTEYIKDIGTPDRLDRACQALRDGVVARSSLGVRQRAVFLDRDGCLNALNGHVSTPEALRVFPFAGPAVLQLNRAGYRTVLVTNQPVLARGECTSEGMSQIHAKLESTLGEAGAYLDAIYVCPHHPHRGYPNEVTALKVDCACRKPRAGMLLDAARDLNIDLAQSWMIGDSESDMEAGRRAGVTTVLVVGEACTSGQAAPPRADFVVKDLAEAARLITVEHPLFAAARRLVASRSDAVAGARP